MQVTLIDYTGNGHPDVHYAARKLIYAKSTRLTQGEATRRRIQNMEHTELKTHLEEVANSIRSSWEFVEVTFEIVGHSRACSDQICRSRVGVAHAVQAMRVADMSSFETVVPNTVKSAGHEGLWELTQNMIATSYSKLRAAGIPAQDARGLIPLNACTAQLFQLNLRALAELVGKRQNLRAQGEYSDIVAEMAKQTLHVWPWAAPFLYPDRLATPTIDEILKDALGDRSPVDVPRVNKALKELDKLKATWG